MLKFHMLIKTITNSDILSLFILTIAAAESAIALALIMSYFKIFRDILFDY